MTAWIALGGNRGDSDRLLDLALAEMDAVSGISVLRRSLNYRSPPWGVVEQPDFVNAVAELDSDMGPLELLGVLQGVEQRLGRRRSGERWGPRSIDLDLLTYEDMMLESAELVLPHREMHRRAFVLVPLLELEPGFVIPGRGAASDWLSRVDPEERAGVLPLPVRL